MTISHVRTHTLTTNALARALTRSILEHPHDHEWSLQGFGMLRTYLDGDRNLRLHVWDSRFKVKDVDEIHTHPWDFHSYVVAGKVVNQRFGWLAVEDLLDLARVVKVYRQQEILCGPGGHETPAEPQSVVLVPQSREMVLANDRYSQLAHEIHRSQPDDGTVTIIQREFLDDADHAFVYIPEGQEWVSAEPRQATKDEVEEICGNALKRWF